jgi:hypothetical protein
MDTLQLINFIAKYAIRHPNFQTVVIGPGDDLTILEAIADLSLNGPNMDWAVNTTDCKNTILVY